MAVGPTATRLSTRYALCRHMRLFVRVAKRLARLYLVPDPLFLHKAHLNQRYAYTKKLANETRTSTFNSGNPPSTFLSQTRTGGASLSTVNQTRNRPAVSSMLSGMVVMLLIAGDGKVKNSSVATHWALCSLGQLHVEHFKMLALDLGVSEAYQRH